MNRALPPRAGRRPPRRHEPRTAHHLIETLRWECRHPQPGGAAQHQQRLAEFFRSDGARIIETLFEQCSPRGERWQLERLEIDLGVLRAKASFSEWGERLQQTLSSELLRLQQQDAGLRSAGRTDTGDTDDTDDTGDTDAATNADAPGTPADQSISPAAGADRSLAAFVHYLEHGYLPWTADRLEARDLSGWLTRLARHHGSQLWQRLHALQPPETALQRLTQITPHDGLQALLETRDRELASALNWLDLEVLMPLYTHGQLSAYELQQLQQHWRAASLRALWPSTASVLSAERRQNLLQNLSAALEEILGSAAAAYSRTRLQRTPPQNANAPAFAAQLLQTLLAADPANNRNDRQPTSSTARDSGIDTVIAEPQAGRRPDLADGGSAADPATPGDSPARDGERRPAAPDSAGAQTIRTATDSAAPRSAATARRARTAGAATRLQNAALRQLQTVLLGQRSLPAARLQDLLLHLHEEQAQALHGHLRLWARQRRQRRRWSRQLDTTTLWLLLGVLAEPTRRQSAEAGAEAGAAPGIAPEATAHMASGAPPGATPAPMSTPPAGAALTTLHGSEALRQFSLREQAHGIATNSGRGELEAALLEYSLRHLALGGAAPQDHRAWEALWQQALQEWRSDAAAAATRGRRTRSGKLERTTDSADGGDAQALLDRGTTATQASAEHRRETSAATAPSGARSAAAAASAADNLAAATYSAAAYWRHLLQRHGLHAGRPASATTAPQPRSAATADIAAARTAIDTGAGTGAGLTGKLGAKLAGLLGAYLRTLRSASLQSRQWPPSLLETRWRLELAAVLATAPQQLGRRDLAERQRRWLQTAQRHPVAAATNPPAPPATNPASHPASIAVASPRRADPPAPNTTTAPLPSPAKTTTPPRAQTPARAASGTATDLPPRTDFPPAAPENPAAHADVLACVRSWMGLEIHADSTALWTQTWHRQPQAVQAELARWALHRAWRQRIAEHWPTARKLELLQLLSQTADGQAPSWGSRGAWRWLPFAIRAWTLAALLAWQRAAHSATLPAAAARQRLQTALWSAAIEWAAAHPGQSATPLSLRRHWSQNDAVRTALQRADEAAPSANPSAAAHAESVGTLPVATTAVAPPGSDPGPASVTLTESDMESVADAATDADAATPGHADAAAAPEMAGLANLADTIDARATTISALLSRPPPALLATALQHAVRAALERPETVAAWLENSDAALRWAWIQRLYGDTAAARLLRLSAALAEIAAQWFAALPGSGGAGDPHWQFLLRYLFVEGLPIEPALLVRRYAMHLRHLDLDRHGGRASVSLQRWLQRLHDALQAGSVAEATTASPAPATIGDSAAPARGQTGDIIAETADTAAAATTVGGDREQMLTALRPLSSAAEQWEAQLPAAARAALLQDLSPAAPATAPAPPATVEPAADGVPIYVDNAGLVLLSGYLQRLFTTLQLLDGSRLADAAAQQRAVHCLSHLVWGCSRADEAARATATKTANPTANEAANETSWVLDKLLCGIALRQPLAPAVGANALDDDTRALLDSLLDAVIAHWKALGNTSVAGLRTSFLQRQGRLIHQRDDQGAHWRLRVEPKAYDLLLDRLPWGYATIKLPWMEEVLHVDWR